MKKNTKTILIGGGVAGIAALIWWWLARSRKRNIIADEVSMVEQPVLDDAGGGEKETAKNPTLGSVIRGIGRKIEHLPDTPEIVHIDAPRNIEAKKPAPKKHSKNPPSNPARYDQIGPGFRGYILAERGKFLSHYARKLGLGATQWRQIRDLPENAWLKKLANAKIQGTHGFDLRPIYGYNPPSDCVAPGYKALKYKRNTGHFPVFYWRG